MVMMTMVVMINGLIFVGTRFDFFIALKLQIVIFI